MEKLSKLRIAEDLKLYFWLIQEARIEQDCTFEDIFKKNTKNLIVEEDLMNRYYEMLNVFCTVNLLNSLGVLKDDMLPFLKKDNEINDKLSFLDSCFVDGSNPKDFNKVDIIMYIRNAFFHSEQKDLYYINSDGSVYIDMPGLGLFLNIPANVLDKICNIIELYTQKGIAYYFENQSDINMSEILKDEESCICELSKIKIIRLQNAKKTTKNIKEMHFDLPRDQELKNIENFADYIVDVDKKQEKFEFYLSYEQCESIAKQIDLLKKYFDINIFLMQIVSNNLEFGIFKYEKMIFDVFRINEFFFNKKNTFNLVNSSMVNDLTNFIGGKDLTSDNFFDKYYFDYGKLNGNIYKDLFLYLIESSLFPYNELSIYFSYVFTNFVNYDGSKELEHIRNAFAHKRFCWLKEHDYKKSSIFLFDNINDVRKPVSLDSAEWSKKFTISEINDYVEQVFLKCAKEEKVAQTLFMCNI